MHSGDLLRPASSLDNNKQVNTNDLKSSNKKILKLDKTSVLTNGHNGHTASFSNKQHPTNVIMVKKQLLNSNTTIKYDVVKPGPMASSNGTSNGGSSTAKPILVLKNISDMKTVNLQTKPGNTTYINFYKKKISYFRVSV